MTRPATLLSALVLAIVAGVGALLWPRHDSLSASTKPVRNSVRIVDSVHAAAFDSFASQIAHAPADTIGAILRDRARRPPLRVISVYDTIRDTMTTAGDVGSPELREVALSCSDARALVIRDSALSMLPDSLRGVIAIQDAVIDSMAAACQPVTPWRGYGVAFGAGYAAGLLTCVVAR